MATSFGKASRTRTAGVTRRRGDSPIALNCRRTLRWPFSTLFWPGRRKATSIGQAVSGSTPPRNGVCVACPRALRGATSCFPRRVEHGSGQLMPARPNVGIFGFILFLEPNHRRTAVFAFRAHGLDARGGVKRRLCFRRRYGRHPRYRPRPPPRSPHSRYGRARFGGGRCR